MALPEDVTEEQAAAETAYLATLPPLPETDSVSGSSPAVVAESLVRQLHSEVRQFFRLWWSDHVLFHVVSDPDYDKRDRTMFHRWMRMQAAAAWNNQIRDSVDAWRLVRAQIQIPPGQVLKNRANRGVIKDTLRYCYIGPENVLVPSRTIRGRLELTDASFTYEKLGVLG